ncbi:uncharacterized protein LOC119629800 [Bombyx mori]|uniref:uncharacterized protein LOC119629800 n=1 Tax=Bombyx mori TaxID=7091 RepID=UPI002ED3FD6C
MHAIRTPAKGNVGHVQSPGTSKAAETNVRKSISEWEGTKRDSSSTSEGKTTQAGPAEAKSAQNTKQPALRKVLSPKAPNYASRTAEAKACLVKGKMNLNNSRNLKTEIKSEVAGALDRIYQLVKEAEIELKKEKSKERNSGSREVMRELSTSDTTFTLSPDTNELATKIEEHTNLLLENTQKMVELRETLEKQKETLEKMSTLTYASVTATPTAEMSIKQGPARSTLHSVVVTSSDDKETGEEVLSRVRNAIDAKEGWIRVEKIRKAKDRKIIIGLGTKEDREKLKNKLVRDGVNLNVETVKNKDPLLILKNVLNINTDEDIHKAMRNQNKDVFQGLDEREDRMEIKYKKKSRNPHTGHIIISVSPTIYQRAMSRGYVHIDLQRIRIEDQSPLVQCTRCLGFGHGKRFCAELADLCSHCGGPHLRAECVEWLSKAVPPKCYNCTKRKRLATNELFMEAVKRKIDIALLQEPYIGGDRVMKGHAGMRIFQGTGEAEGVVKSAIVVFDNELNVTQYPELTTNNIVVVGINTSAWKITAISFYFEPDQPVEPYMAQLSRIREEIGPGGWIIGGDTNAKSTWWGSPVTDHKGEDLQSALTEMNFAVLNTGKIPTFDTVRGGKRYSSYVDITACTIEVLDLVDDWKIEEGLTSSDHNGILFNIYLEKSKGIRIERTTRLFNTKKANWPEFCEKLRQSLQNNQITGTEIESIHTIDQIEYTVNKITEVITEICNLTIAKKIKKEYFTLPWWSKELEEMKRNVATKKRRIRCAAHVRRTRVVEEYLQTKEEYEIRAAKAQTESWKEFCKKQDKEGIWEGIYRVIGRVTKRVEDSLLQKDGKTLTAQESVELLAETFYPEDSISNDDEHHSSIRQKASRVDDGEQNELCEPAFTMEEIERASESFSSKKAPGADGFTADICCQAIKSSPEVFLTLLNKCLEQNYFPKIWKKATVIVLRKPGKENYTNPKSYRPIGLLPILGKIYEKMLVARLKHHLIPRISTRQYGFMPQRSTEDSLYTLIEHIRNKIDRKKIVTLISLDIEGAFDSAWWPAIRVRLAEVQCPIGLRRVMASYLRDRQVSVRYAGKTHTQKTSKGCVQGSVAGPILWNLLIDPLLGSFERRGDYCQAFADDVVLVVDGDTALEIETKANAALKHAREWGVRNKLKFAAHKTKAITITRKLKYDTPRLSMGRASIEMVKEIKMLGVTIDDKLTFNSHVSNVCRKAINIYKKLSRAAKASWGLHPEVIRTIYMAVMEPVILYAASVWAPAVNKLGTQKQLGIVQRGIAQKICRAYRTVSLHSALILAGTLPLDLRVREVAALYRARRGSAVPELCGREVEKMTSVAGMPHPAECTRIGVTRLVDQDDVEMHSAFDIRIFTDGSKINHGVGAALSVWNSEAEIKTRKLVLPSFCTVYQAELLALCVATKEAMTIRARTFGVYSDSMAALQTIQNYSCLHPLAVQARENIKRISREGKTIRLHWIKAHVGLEGNERADELAKGAAVDTKRKPDYDRCPIAYIKRGIRAATLDEWNRRYNSGETASITKLFFPDAKAAYKIVRKLVPTYLTTQIMTGHGGFSEYLSRFKCKESPSCICDPAQSETIQHLLLVCPIHAMERFELEQRVQHNLTLDMIKELIAGNNRELFMKYLKVVLKEAEICEELNSENRVTRENHVATWSPFHWELNDVNYLRR